MTKKVKSLEQRNRELVKALRKIEDGCISSDRMEEIAMEALSHNEGKECRCIGEMESLNDFENR